MSALGHTRAHWSGVLAMTLCVFVLIASEFMPVSLLTPIAGDLHITEGLAGQGIALSGALAVLTSLTISPLTGSLDRKWLLLGLPALMAGGSLCLLLTTNEFGIVLFIGAKGVNTLPMMVYSKAILESDYSVACMIALINILLSLGLFMLYRLAAVRTGVRS